MCFCDSLGMANVGDGAVQGDPVADEDVEAILPVGLVHPVSIRQGKRLPLLAVSCITDTQAPVLIPVTVKTKSPCGHVTPAAYGGDLSMLLLSSDVINCYGKKKTSELPPDILEQDRLSFHPRDPNKLLSFVVSSKHKRNLQVVHGTRSEAKD